MDQLLPVISAVVSFVFVLIMISRAAKYIILLGLALLAFIVLTALGIVNV